MTDSNNGQQTLIEHLTELRERLLKALLAIFAIFLGLFYFANDLYTFVSKPIRDQLPDGTTMIATEVTATFFAPFNLTLVLSLFLAMPVILHQAWRFISPGLYAHEKRLAMPLLASSIVLFYAGIAFAYYVIFPIIMAFFTSVGPQDVQVTPDISQYLNIALKLFFAFGVAFEIPIAVMLSIWSGLTTADDLKQKRPYVIVGCFIFGMLLTPPDPFSQSMLAIPMWLLFEGGVWMGRFVKNRSREERSS